MAFAIDLIIGLTCKYFDFKHVANEIYNEQVYPIYMLRVNKEQIINKIEKF